MPAFFYDYTLSPAPDGANKVFTVTLGYYEPGTIAIYRGGILGKKGGATSMGWSELDPLAGTIEFTIAPLTGDDLFAFYADGPIVEVCDPEELDAELELVSLEVAAELELESLELDAELELESLELDATLDLESIELDASLELDSIELEATIEVCPE